MITTACISLDLDRSPTPLFSRLTFFRSCEDETFLQPPESTEKHCILFHHRFDFRVHFIISATTCVFCYIEALSVNIEPYPSSSFTTIDANVRETKILLSHLKRVFAENEERTYLI